MYSRLLVSRTPQLVNRLTSHQPHPQSTLGTGLRFASTAAEAEASIKNKGKGLLNKLSFITNSSRSKLYSALTLGGVAAAVCEKIMLC